VLFITTDDDRLVPPEESYRLNERAGEPKKLVVLRPWFPRPARAVRAVRTDAVEPRAHRADG
jgi:hypothetical protein